MRRKISVRGRWWKVAVVTALVWGGPSAGGGAGERNVAPTGKSAEELALPPLAVVKFRDTSGETWGYTGVISGDLPIAARDFEMCLSSQGWQWHSDTSLGDMRRRTVLAVWKKGPRRLLVMLWEKAAGETGFSVGEERADQEKGNSSGR